MEWKWTIGEPYERSKIQDTTRVKPEPLTQTAEAYSSALHFDENAWDMLNQSSTTSRREELDAKLGEREKVTQIGRNPFLGENNYVDNITRLQKPLNTSIDKSYDTINK